jgi:probable 2-oxoglutarate dehydrogenase E1 component DHKTD1
MYSSDIVKMTGVPIIHVNAEDPEAVVAACRLAVQFRATFKKDVMVDLIAYRKHGHNEVDEPSFTQPLMYKNIRSRKSIVAKYGEKLQAEGLLTDATIAKVGQRLVDYLEAELAATAAWKPSAADHFQGRWRGVGQSKDMHVSPATGVEAAALREAGMASVTYPANMSVHPRLQRLHAEVRLQRLQAGEGIDWATAEALAMGTLMREGFDVRIAGQDVERGTFSHRHAVLVDQDSEGRVNCLNSAGYKGVLQAVNSPLSEEAVMGFELGYSWESPNALCIWEAQFGDFNNGAQIIIDQFITSSEDKWLRSTGLTLLLPHGYDGAGPEHSSCRIERFLQLCDGDSTLLQQTNTNLIVANVTTPANYFHLLRRQMLRNYRKPLVLAAPKTVLRLSSAVSALAEMGPGTQFQPVLGDTVAEPAAVEHVVLCSGKVFYDVDGARKSTGRLDMAVVRIEELNPFPFAALRAELARYDARRVKTITWFQEEPQNAGAWSFVEPRLVRLALSMGYRFEQVEYQGRAPLASPAVGCGALHKQEVQALMRGLFKTSVITKSE